MSDIFISHATADRHLAELLVDFLTDAIGVPETSIFCSSLEGHGNPLTHDFNKNMREQIQHPKLVILLMTPAYLDSRFCVMELGGTWALELRPLPIIVPPVTFADVTNTIGQIQGWNITDSKSLETFRQTVLKTLDTPGRGNHNFERKRLRWEADLAAALERLAPSQKIPVEMYKELKDDNQALKVKLAERRQELLEARAQLQAMKSMRPVALVV